MLDPDVLEARISKARFATYVSESGGDRHRAVDLYHWTGRLSGALAEDFRCLEVVFRNVLNDALTAHHATIPARPSGAAWFDQPTWVKHHWWNTPALANLEKAVRRAKHDPSAVSRPNAVVAELSFGFWRYVISARYEQSFWIPALDQAFDSVPGSTPMARREKLEANIKVLHKLRNRIAHHEPIFKPTTFVGPGRTKMRSTVADQSSLLFEVLHWIDPNCATWTSENSLVPQVLAERP